MQYRDTIYAETMGATGFMSRLRENTVDTEGYARLRTAIGEATEDIRTKRSVDRLLVACLFEVPWEIENTVEHYGSQNREEGQRVNKMAEELREAINELMWAGLEEFYKK